MVTLNIITKESFSEKVENFAISHGTDFMDALIAICDKEKIEHEGVNKLITPALKSKLQVELEDKKLIKVDYKKLPI